jgi:hypothetical protein
MHDIYKKFLRIGLLLALILPFYSNAQNKVELIHIAQKHLNAEQIKALTIPEINALNYMFTSSFIIDTTTTVYKKWAADNGAVDVVLLNPQRKKTERTFYKNEKYPGFIIEFLSRDEVDKEINKILNTP